jgi:hypothetical protein
LKDRWLIHPASKTTSGIFIASVPFQTIPVDADSAVIGGAVRAALAASLDGVPHPTDWKGISSPRLAAAGVKTEATFQRTSKLVSITRTGAEIVLVPTSNGGASGENKGFHNIDDCAIVVNISCSDESLGLMVHDALAKCC